MAEEMNMEGANMDPLSAMDPEARQMMMQADEDIAAVLLARLANMSPEELQSLDSAITPAVASVLMKLLPELGQIIDAVNSEGEMPEQGEMQMGALSGM
jgi:hypothetical protein|tara:strand:+ start:755 stop:1051 length:297 start_codon:yes stop_codon:yes gene_type:complete